MYRCQAIRPSSTALHTLVNPSGTYTLTTALQVTTANDGVARYLYVGAQDLFGQYRERTYGPFYQDMPTLPDYLSMNEPQGPHAGKPYLEWLDSGCTEVGWDIRSGVTQQWFATSDADTIIMAWRGADWNRDGDLFFYMDTISDTYGPYQQHGGGVAYNPYTSTQHNTLVVLPSDEWTPGQWQTGMPTLNRMNADYGVWVRDEQTAIMLRWNDVAFKWEEWYQLPAPGDPMAVISGTYSLVRDTDQVVTLVSLPRDLIGYYSGYLFSTAFTTEEDALRLWSAIAPQNKIDSPRLVRIAPKVGEPERLMLDVRTWADLSAGVCQTPDHLMVGTLQNEQASTDNTSDPNIALLLPRPYSYAATDPWRSAFDPYDDAYNTWLIGEYCPTNLNHPECRLTKNRTQDDAQVILSQLGDTHYSPLQPGQTVTYTYRFDYNGQFATGDNSWFYFQITGTNGLAWPNNCAIIGGNWTDPWAGVYNIKPYTSREFVFTGTVGMETIDQVQVNAVWLKTTSPASLQPCNPTSASNFPYPLDTSTARHTPDRAAPRYADIRSPRDLVRPEITLVRGVVADASPVTTLTLQIESPTSATTTQTCLDDTPGDGLWECPWDVTATNGGVTPESGQAFRLRVSATDPFRQTGDWSPWRTVYVDTTPPTLTVRADLRGLEDFGSLDVALLPLLDPNNLSLSGQLDDNRVVDAALVCDEAGANCSAASLLIDSGTLTETQFTYDDEPLAPIAIVTDTAQLAALNTPLAPNAPEVCGANTVGIERQFVVTDTYNVADVQVGVNISHSYRSDLLVKLSSPTGQRVTLIDDSNKVAQNYDALVTDAVPESFTAGRASDDVTAPYYDTPRNPINPLSSLIGAAAQGVWTLVICDRDVSKDVGEYNRARLILTAARVDQNTQASWRYDLPVSPMDDLDNAVYTRTLIGLDSLGNRTLTQTLAYRIDMVAPVLTVTQIVTPVILTDTVAVLYGLVSDGGEVNVSVTVIDPLGAQSQQTSEVSKTSEVSGAWQFVLQPTQPGDYTLSVNAIDAAGNQTVSGPYTVKVIAALGLTKEVTPQTDVPLGSVVTYTLRLYNANPDPIAGVVITDPLPALLNTATFVTGTAFSVDNAVLSWDPLTITGQSELDFVFTAIVTNAAFTTIVTDTVTNYGATISNTAYLNVPGFALVAPSVDLTLEARPLGPSLTITKTVTAARRPVWPGDPITYTIIAANAGGPDAADVSITDTLPAGITGTTFNWTGILTSGETLSFTVSAWVISETSILGQSLTNTAWLSHTSAQLSAAAAVTIRGGYAIYLPVVRR